MHCLGGGHERCLAAAVQTQSRLVICRPASPQVHLNEQVNGCWKVFTMHPLGWRSMSARGCGAAHREQTGEEVCIALGGFTAL